MSLVFHCQHRYTSGFALDVRFQTDSEVTALYGPSGSGKTTILSLIAGLLKPDKGYVRLGERILTDTQSRVFLNPERRGVGMLFQDPCLFPHLRVRGNLTYGMRRQRGEVIKLDRVVKILQLEGLLDRYPSTLSGGERHRVALARAILCAPRLLLLDEPLTAVEYELRERIASFVDRVVAEFRIPTLLVSHNESLVNRLAQNVLVIANGKMANSRNPIDSTAKIPR